MKFFTCKYDKCFKCVFLNPQNNDLLSLIINEATNYSYNNVVPLNIEKNVNIAIRRKYLDVLLNSNEAIIGIEVNGFNKLIVIQNLENILLKNKIKNLFLTQLEVKAKLLGLTKENMKLLIIL